MSGEELLAEARKFEKNLLNFFWRQGVSHFDGEDLVQETYLRLWRYRDRYEPTAKLTTFLFMLARQVRIDALRRSSYRAEHEGKYAGFVAADGVQRPHDPACADVRWAISRLSPPLADVVELGVFQGLAYAEIAEILDIPVGTVKSRMSNALKKLKEVLDDERS